MSSTRIVRAPSRTVATETAPSTNASGKAGAQSSSVPQQSTAFEAHSGKDHLLGQESQAPQQDQAPKKGERVLGGALMPQREKAEAKGEAKEKGKAKGEGKADAKAKAHARGEGKADAKAKAHAKGEGKADAKALAKAKGEGKADAKALAKGEGKADAKALAKGEGKADAKALAKGEGKADAKALAKGEGKADAKALAKGEGKADAKALAKGEGKADAKALAKGEGKAVTGGEAKSQQAAQAKGGKAATGQKGEGLTLSAGRGGGVVTSLKASLERRGVIMTSEAKGGAALEGKAGAEGLGQQIGKKVSGFFGKLRSAITGKGEKAATQTADSTKGAAKGSEFSPSTGGKDVLGTKASQSNTNRAFQSYTPGGGIQGQAASLSSAGKGKASLSSVMMDQAKIQGPSGKGEAESPRHEFRQLLKQWATAKESIILENFQSTTMFNNVAALAWKFASLVQQGVVPTSTMTSLLKSLKKPGSKKRLKKIKDLLVKKGIVPTGISTEVLELIAAMIATYLAKMGDSEAEDMINDLFGMPSRKIHLPEGGGEHHEEGREEQAHQDHREGNYISDDKS